MDPKRLIAYMATALGEAQKAREAADYAKRCYDAAQERGDDLDMAAWAAEGTSQLVRCGIFQQVASAIRADYLRLTEGNSDDLPSVDPDLPIN